MWQFFGIFCAFKEGTIFNFIKIIFLSFGFLICACSSTEATTLKILTHDSFDAKQELIDEFTKTHNIHQNIQRKIIDNVVNMSWISFLGI